MSEDPEMKISSPSGTFNLMKKMAVDVPNGTGISSIPNGSDFGNSPGVQLSNGGGQGMGMPGMEEGNQQKTPLRDIVGDLLHAAARNTAPEEIALIAKKAMNTEIPQELMGNEGAFKMINALGRRATEDQSSQAINPDTGIKEHTLDQLASQIANEAGWNPEELIEEAEERSNMSEQNIGVQASLRTAADSSDSQNPLKKRKRGNPFKVLMGKVQKLLDHGLGKNEIVKKLKKDWDPETISRCVGIVKEYNRRNKRKDKSKDDSEGSEDKKAFNLKHYMERSAAEKPGFKYEDKKPRESIYDIERDPSMQSTMELLTRLTYLNHTANFSSELSNENLGGPEKTVDKRSISSQKQAVLDELHKRKYSDEDLSPLVEIASGEISEEG